MKTIIGWLFAVSFLALSLCADGWPAHRDADWLPDTTPGATNAIDTAAQLAQFAHLTNTGHVFTDVTFLVTRDIDLSSHEWVPAATNAIHAFSAAFTAVPGVVINGLTIRTPDGDAGFFSYVERNAHISEITLSNVFIHVAVSDEYNKAGGIAGVNCGTISRCAVHGEMEIETQGCLGGIVGLNYEGRIADCTNFSAIRSTSKIFRHIEAFAGMNLGGVIGLNHGDVINCVNRGMLDADSAGGIAGENTGTLDHCVNHAPVSGAVLAGGIVSINCKMVINCRNNAPVSGMSAGGIACLNVEHMANIASIVNSINTGSVTGTTDGGGIAVETSAGMTANCLNAGMIKAPLSGGITASVIVGERAVSMSNCYWLAHTARRVFAEKHVDGRYDTKPAPDNPVLSVIHDIAAAAKSSYIGFKRSRVKIIFDCAAADPATGRLDKKVTVNGTATRDLLTALNLWVDANAVTNDPARNYRRWRASPDGIPRL